MFIRLPSYLNNNCLDAAHVCLPRCMLLHILTGCVHCDQNACVGCHDNTAWKDVAEDEECHSVGACCGVLIGQAPVNATGGAIRLWSIFPPVGQWGAGKQQGIDPSTGNEQTAVNGVKPVPCENSLDFIVHVVERFWHKYYLLIFQKNEIFRLFDNPGSLSMSEMSHHVNAPLCVFSEALTPFKHRNKLVHT